MRAGIRQVLLISRETGLSRYLGEVLPQAGTGFVQAEGVEQALALLKHHTPEVILLAPPPREGLKETVRTLRETAGGPVLIFAVDQAQSDQVQDELAHSGVDGLVAWPLFLSNLALAVERARSRETAADRGDPVLRGMRFLCAEDNALNAESLSALLEMYGASCIVCPDGEAVVRAFESMKPGDYDAILMDVQLPRMNGYEAARAIRTGQNPLGRTIPIIAMTANAFSDDVRRSMESGMDAHISKPIGVELLERAIRCFAEKSTGEGHLSATYRLRRPVR